MVFLRKVLSISSEENKMTATKKKPGRPRSSAKRAVKAQPAKATASGVSTIVTKAEVALAKAAAASSTATARVAAARKKSS
jgi:hypothetical protein